MSILDHHEKIYLFGKDVTNCLVVFALLAFFAFVCVAFIVNVILFSLTYQKSNTLEENFMEWVDNFSSLLHNLNSSLNDIKSVIVNDTPEKIHYLNTYSFLDLV